MEKRNYFIEYKWVGGGWQGGLRESDKMCVKHRVGTKKFMTVVFGLIKENKFK